MLVNFTLTSEERECLLSHVAPKSKGSAALTGAAPDISGAAKVAASRISVECEQEVALELLDVAMAHCDSAATTITRALSVALRR